MNPVMVAPGQAQNWIGHVVCIGLQNGEYYVGQICGVKNGEVILSGVKGSGSMPERPGKQEKAQINGLLGSLFGGAGAAPGTGGAPAGFPSAGNALVDGARGFGLTGFGGIMGGVRKYWPMIRMGIGAVRFIMPLLGRFFI